MRRKRPERDRGNHGDSRRLIELGRIAGSYGLRGWVKVAAEPGALAAQRTWWVDGRELGVEEAKAHSGNVLAKLEGIETREQARGLIGRTVSVRRADLPEPAAGIYYWSDLLGLEVVNEQGLVLGAVEEMFSNGAHDVMAVTGEREHLIPWVPAVVTKVDLAARVIRVKWGADW